MDATFTTPPVPERPRPTRRLLGDALRRPGGRRALSVLSIVLALAGAAMFAYPFGTDLWSSRIQSRLRTQFTDPKYAEAYKRNQIKEGQTLTRLRIPDIKVDVLVVEGTTPAALKAGAGHYTHTPKPGELGNVAIAGHRTTYGRPFARLDELTKGGQSIFLETPVGIFEYKTVKTFDGRPNPHAVKPTDYGVVRPPRNAKAKWLTLTTCHPKGSARERLVLRAVFYKKHPLPAK